jgi:hypothetical protein
MTACHWAQKTNSGLRSEEKFMPWREVGSSCPAVFGEQRADQEPQIANLGFEGDLSWMAGLLGTTACDCLCVKGFHAQDTVLTMQRFGGAKKGDGTNAGGADMLLLMLLRLRSWRARLMLLVPLGSQCAVAQFGRSRISVVLHC